MEEAVPHVDEGVLVHVGVADPVGSHVVVVVVVERDIVVVALVFRHGLWITGLTLHTLTADSRSTWQRGSDLRSADAGQTVTGAENSDYSLT